MAWFECTGGSGSSGPTETVLVNTSSSTTAWASPLIFSSFNISDYDQIKIEGTSYSDGTWNIKHIFSTDDIPVTDAAGNGCMSIGGSAYIGNVNDKLYVWTSTGKNTTVNKIIGTVF